MAEKAADLAMLKQLSANADLKALAVIQSRVRTFISC
jgi:hypothetical protein